MGRILLWIAALVISAAIITALVVWLAPLIAALVVLYIASKVVCHRARVEATRHPSEGNLKRAVDS